MEIDWFIVGLVVSVVILGLVFLFWGDRIVGRQYDGNLPRDSECNPWNDMCHQSKCSCMDSPFPFLGIGCKNWRCH